MPLNYENAEPQQDYGLIPINTLCKIKMEIRQRPDIDELISAEITKQEREEEYNWLTPSQTSDAMYLNCEFTIVSEQYNGRKFWGNMVTSGGKTNDQGESIAGNITKSMLRAIISSGRGLQPTDMKPGNWVLQNGYPDLFDLEFAVKIGIEKGKNNYPDKNKILAVITPDKKEYAGIMSGAVQTEKPVQTTAPWKDPAPAPTPNNPTNVPAWGKR